MDMTEPGSYPMPINSFEVFTINSATHTVKKTHKFDPYETKNMFPRYFVCKIYSDLKSVGTGFVHKTPSGQLLIITAHHVQKTIISEPSRYFACFQYKQKNLKLEYSFEKLDLNNHNCDKKIFKIIPTGLISNYNAGQKDPVTNQLYSMDNDLTAFSLQDECLCGRKKKFPKFTFLEIGPVPNVNTRCFVFGYAGQDISLERVIPHSPEYFNILQTQSKNLRSNSLLWTKGKVISSGDLVAIDASSVPGFSGGPILYKDAQKWKIFGILLGGPAIQGHRELLSIYGHVKFNEIDSAKQKIKDLGHLLPSDIFIDLKKILKSFLQISITEESLSYFKSRYYRLISHFCKTKEISKELLVAQLNHNLGIQVNDFIHTLI